MLTQDRVQVYRDGVPDVQRPELGKLIGQVSSQRFLEPSAAVIPTYMMTSGIASEKNRVKISKSSKNITGFGTGC